MSEKRVTELTEAPAVHRSRLLIVDDEEAARFGMRRALARLAEEIIEAGDVDAARSLLALHEFDVVLLDVNLPGTSGMDFLRELRGESSGSGDSPLVVLITAHGSERLAADAIKAGAYDYIAKPFEVDDLRLVAKNALETSRLRRENQSLKAQIAAQPEDRVLLGKSIAIEKVRALIEKVAETEVTVLVRGESGTGKELVAREIHRSSGRRRSGAFVAINCAALPAELVESELFGHEKGSFTGASARRRGKFELAQGGTLFLDEIGDMSVNVQAKLLRALEERAIERVGGSEPIPVDVRIVSATHRFLEEDVNKGGFRSDLFYRLRVVTIEVPPLRERPEDIPLLAESFIRQTSARYRIPYRPLSTGALRRLLEYRWPGNVRELRNVIERTMILSESDHLTEKDLPAEVRGGESRKAAARATGDTGDLVLNYTANFRADRREFERRYIARCLEEARGNVTRAAEVLGMHRQSLQHKLRELGLGRRYVATETDE